MRPKVFPAVNEVTPQTVYADFNNHNGRYLLLSCDGTKADLKKRGIVLREGLVLRVSDGDLAGTGTVKWSPEFTEWVIDIDPRDIVDLHEHQ